MLQKRNFVASGSWNIQEELRRVRAKATEDMLRTPSSRTDPSLFAIATSRKEGMGKKAIEPDSFRKMYQIGVLMDAGVSSDPVLAGWFISCLNVQLLLCLSENNSDFIYKICQTSVINRNMH